MNYNQKLCLIALINCVVCLYSKANGHELVGQTTAYVALVILVSIPFAVYLDIKGLIK